MGVRGKLFMSMLALAVLAALAPAGYAIYARQDAAMLQFEEQGRATGRHLSRTLGQLAAQLHSINDSASIHNVLAEQNVIAACVLDSEGLLVNDGSTKNTRRGHRVPDFDRVQDEVTSTRDFVVRRNRSELVVSGPVLDARGEIFGFVHLQLTTAGVGAITPKSIQNLATVVVSTTVLALIFSFVYASRVRQPIKLVLDAMEAIQDGNYKVRLPIRSSDELGRMADRVNGMATVFRQAMVSKRYLDEVLQSMVDTLIVVDTEANIVTVNRATVEILGYSEKSLIGQPASLVCIDEGYQLTGSRLQHLLGEKTQADHELHYKTSEGDLIPISFSGSPIRDNTSQVVGYVCIGKDITDRKRAEEERERLNKKLIDTSRQAGMAEVATGVLHNVGNVLNSVNMSASVVVEHVKMSKVAGLNKAVQLIKTHDDDLARFLSEDERGKQLPSYFEQLAHALSDEQASILGELSSLTKNIDHIKEIITMQQSYSKVSGVLESVSLSEIIDEALRLNASSLEKNGIRVEREVAYVPQVHTDKHKVLQVVVNLITNARDATKDGPDGQRHMVIKLSKTMAKEDGDIDRVCIAVKDSGCGIPSDNLTRIFTHGFTTKKEGHGFGLHSSALTAKDLGGAITAHSDGLGQGSTFMLSLPLKVAETTA